MTSELEFIRQLTQRFPPLPPVELGIGDDGAVLQSLATERIVVVTDMLLDGVHFDLRSASPELVGRKAIAVNLSDLAAMGCRPTAAFVSIALPQHVADRAAFLESLYAGIEQMIVPFGFSLAGGDTNSWAGPFAINVCLTGTPYGTNVFQRSTARPGDELFVSGPLGGSLRSGRHLTFQPRLELSRWLSGLGSRLSVMDISDGMAIDLHRMMEASNVGAVLDADSIPIHRDVPSEWSHCQRLHAALSDGEDFELLIAASAESAAELRRESTAAGFELHAVGTVSAASGVFIRDGRDVRPLPPDGWQH